MTCWRASMLVWMLLLPLASSAQEAASWEQPGSASAKDLLPPALLKSEHHSVDDAVQSDGFQYRYTVRSEWGDFEVWGDTLLSIRVQELEALAVLKETGGADDAVRDSLHSLGDRVQNAAEDLVEDPGAFAGGLFGAVKKRVGRVAGKTVNTAKAVGSGQATRAVKKDVGIDKEARQLHERLGTDPYTRNEVLAKAVNDAAWNQAVARAAIDPVALSDAEGLPLQDTFATLYAAPPDKVRERNRALLLESGASEAQVRTLVEHPEFSLTLQTLSATDFGRLKGVARLGALLEEDQPVSSEGEAIFVVQSFGMMADYHEREKPLTAIVPDPALLAARNTAGSVVIFAPVDHLLWTEALSLYLDRFFAHNEPETLELWTTGTISPRCREELEKRRFTLRERTGLGDL